MSKLKENPQNTISNEILKILNEAENYIGDGIANLLKKAGIADNDQIVYRSYKLFESPDEALHDINITEEQASASLAPDDIYWIDEDSKNAKFQGWNVFLSGGGKDHGMFEIQYIQDPEFSFEETSRFKEKGDEGAIDFCRKSAMNGNKISQKAFAYLDQLKNQGIDIKDDDMCSEAVELYHNKDSFSLELTR